MIRIVLIALSLLIAAPALAAEAISASCPTGQIFTSGGISVSGAFTRAMLPRAQSAGGYFTISNAGPEADTFTGASSVAAPDIQLHQMQMDGQVMMMAPVEGGLEIRAGGSVALSPSGYHLMMTGMPVPFAEGQCVALVLHFAKAGDVPVQLNVGGVAQQAPPDMAGM